MKIEVGKSYINAEGDVVRSVRNNPKSAYPYICRQYSYTEHGLRYDAKHSSQDLICEVVPEIYATYKNGWYNSYKDFLIAHYEYYSGKKYEQTNL